MDISGLEVEFYYGCFEKASRVNVALVVLIPSASLTLPALDWIARLAIINGWAFPDNEWWNVLACSILAISHKGRPDSV
jgi:hypothetical protein